MKIAILTRSPSRRTLRRLGGTLLVALAAGVAQTAIAQGHGGPGGFDGPGMMMGRGHGIERMLDSVNVSAAQRAQIRQIMQAAAADLKAIHASGRTLHQQSQALFTQPTIDANAAESLRQQMMTLHDQASRRMLQAMIDAGNVLSAEQRKALGDRMSQMRSLMERQRAERAALVKPVP